MHRLAVTGSDITTATRITTDLTHHRGADVQTEQIFKIYGIWHVAKGLTGKLKNGTS